MTSLKVKIGVTENDYEAIARFQRNAFSPDAPDPRIAALQTPAYYHWKYNTPFGQATVGRVLLDGSTVSHLAAIPTILYGGREATKAWQLCDIATHPGHRSAGYFRCLLGEWLSTLPGRDLVYCFPNMRSLPILLTSGFLLAAELRLLVAPVLARTRGSSNYEIDSSPATISPPPSENNTNGDVISTRIDEAYLVWRFALRPDVEYLRLTVRRGNQMGDAFVRSLFVGGQRFCLLMLMRGCRITARPLLKAVAHYAGAERARAVLYLSSTWRGSLLPPFVPVPRLFLPRRFPVVVRPTDCRPLNFSASDWDVL